MKAKITKHGDEVDIDLIQDRKPKRYRPVGEEWDCDFCGASTLVPLKYCRNCGTQRGVVK